MIKTNENGRKTMKEIREKENKDKEQMLRDKCKTYADKKYGAEEIVKLSNAHKGLWFLPILDEEDNIEMMAIMKPIDRHILSYASTKLDSDGLYAFLEQCMNECWLEGDKAIIDEDEYFIPAAMKFNKILEGKKAAFVKR
jgi:hypothetical protein